MKRKVKEPEFTFTHIPHWELLEFDIPDKSHPIEVRREAWLKKQEEVSKAFTGRHIRWFDGETGTIESAHIIGDDGVHYVAEFFIAETRTVLNTELMKLGIGTVID